MEFKKDKTYAFPEMMAYGFTKHEGRIWADCHLYLGENSFEAILELGEAEFRAIVAKSDDKEGEFEQVCLDWFAGEQAELFLPDRFPEPVHCKLRDLHFRFEKSELEDDEFGPERIYHFSVEPSAA